MSIMNTLPLVDIHSTAVIDPTAEIGAGTVIGPYAIIGPNVVIGEGCKIGPHVVIERDTILGSGCKIHKGAVLGGDPQDLKYLGEPTLLLVGDRTVIREYATLNRGTSAHGKTEVGSDCLLMAYTHVAHDCVIGNHVILSNAVNMGGHVVIEDWAIVGGVTPIHQFVRIGQHAFVGGGSRVSKDIPPFVKAAGSPVALYGLNAVGLERRGFSGEVRRELKRAYRILFNSSLNLSQARERVAAELTLYPEVEALLHFIAESERGVAI